MMTIETFRLLNRQSDPRNALGRWCMNSACTDQQRDLRLLERRCRFDAIVLFIEAGTLEALRRLLHAIEHLPLWRLRTLVGLNQSAAQPQWGSRTTPSPLNVDWGDSGDCGLAYPEGRHFRWMRQCANLGRVWRRMACSCPFEHEVCNLETCSRRREQANRKRFVFHQLPGVTSPQLRVTGTRHKNRIPFSPARN